MKRLNVYVPDEIAAHVKAQPNQGRYLAELVAREIGLTLPERRGRGAPRTSDAPRCPVCDKICYTKSGVHMKCGAKAARVLATNGKPARKKQKK